VKIEFGGFPIMLFVVFLVLRLCEVIDWSWWYVTMPLWLIPSIAALGIGGMLLFSFIAYAAEKLGKL
jgi:hypothetical protein